MPNQATLAQIAKIVETYINPDKIAQKTFAPTYDSTTGLLDKIAKSFFIDGLFEDKLPELDGDVLPYGKTLEEYYPNLLQVVDFDPTGASTLAPSDPTYMPASYSYTLGRKKIKTTYRFDDLERAFSNVSEYQDAVMEITKRLQDTNAAYRFDKKKQLLAVYAHACETAMSVTTAFAANAAYPVGTNLKSGTAYGVVVKAIASNSGLTWETAISGGYIVVLDLVSNADIPTDTASGEAFIKLVKTYVRKSKFISEGNALNGSTIGASEGLLLIVNTSIMPSIEVDTWAGAFHKEDALFDVDVKEVDDFGNDTTGVFAILIDRRGCKLHNSYRAVRSQDNADGDFINYVMHTEDTAAYSKNTFVHVFKKA